MTDTQTTYDFARNCNAGRIFTDNKGTRAIYSDRSDGTHQAFGRLIRADGTMGDYEVLPSDMRPERYNVTAAHDFAQRIAAMGFAVYLASFGHYGFITDDNGSRVLSFAFSGYEDTLSGNYGPPSRESGTGWCMDKTPNALRNAYDVRVALYASPPLWCGKGWRNMTTLDAYLGMYGTSSKYRRIGGDA